MLSTQLHVGAPEGQETNQPSKASQGGKTDDDELPLAEAKIKVEKEADATKPKGCDTEDEIKKKITAFLAAPEGSLKSVQNMELESTMILPQARPNELFSNYVEAMTKHLEQLKKCSRGLTHVVSGRELGQGQLPKLIKMMDILTERHGTLRDFAVINHLCNPGSKKVVRKRSR